MPDKKSRIIPWWSYDRNCNDGLVAFRLRRPASRGHSPEYREPFILLPRASTGSATVFGVGDVEFVFMFQYIA